MKLLGIFILRNDYEYTTCTPWPSASSSYNHGLDGRIRSYPMALALVTRRVDRSYPSSNQTFGNRLRLGVFSVYH